MLFGSNLKQKSLQGLSQCDVMKSKTVEIFMHEGHSNLEKSMVLGILHA